MENNKVTVKIYGQEYVIAGEMPKDEIVRLADYVDTKMKEIATAAQSAGANPQNVAILAAVNVANELFKTQKEVETVRQQNSKEIAELRQMNAQLEKDAQHYVQLWDESKKNYSDYKEETQAIVLQKEDLLNQLKQKDDEIAELKTKAEATAEQMQSSMESAILEVENKCIELENSFFELQKENLQLKVELGKYNDANQF